MDDLKEKEVIYTDKSSDFPQGLARVNRRLQVSSFRDFKPVLPLPGVAGTYAGTGECLPAEGGGTS